MSTPNTKRDQLIAKLKEMFQMDQADLDFGIYRIMNAKRDEVERFLDKDLLPTLRTTLEEFQPAGPADKQKELADAIANARKLKIDPDTLEVVQQLKAELTEGGDLDRLENQVYSDLYTFFSRYYQDGDFLSLRRYKEGVYAMPYESEEVKLHWANADQYYIKTAENFTRYAFKTALGRVRFELAAASTERDNNKATADNERRFILAAEPLAMDGDELIIRFEYRPDADKRKQKELSTLAVTSLLALPEGAPLAQAVPQWPAWRAALAGAADIGLRPGDVVLDWYPRVASKASKGVAFSQIQTTRHRAFLAEDHLAFMDFDAIYIALQQLKAERGWHNLNLHRDMPRALLQPGNEWYTLYVPPEVLKADSFEKVRDGKRSQRLCSRSTATVSTRSRRMLMKPRSVSIVS